MPNNLTNTICTVDMVLPAYGGDLLAVNAGRVSYDRWHDEMTDRDRELIKQFANDGDTSPFYHSVATFRITAPLSVKIQLTRHNVGFSAPNEVSRRYTSRHILVHSPEVWRMADGTPCPDHQNATFMGVYESIVNSAVNAYEWMIEAGAAREQARFVLPQGMMVTVLWTGNLYAWHTLCQKRLDPRAQPETRAVAEGIAAAMATAFPVSWPAIMEVGNDD